MPLKRARLRINEYNTKRKSRLATTEKRVRNVSLSLTSMVDMFAIMVIFLLTNASSVSQWLEVGHGIDLPKTKFSDPPPKGATVQISKEAVFVDQKELVKTALVLKGTGLD